jgi:hypothetical protein
MCVFIHLLDALSYFVLFQHRSIFLYLQFLKFLTFYVSIIKFLKSPLLLKLAQFFLSGALHLSGYVVCLFYHPVPLCVFRCLYDVVFLTVLLFLLQQVKRKLWHAITLNPETSYDDPGFVGFLSPSRKMGCSYLNYVMSASSHILSNSLFTNHCTVWGSIIFWATGCDRQYMKCTATIIPGKHATKQENLSFSWLVHPEHLQNSLLIWA